MIVRCALHVHSHHSFDCFASISDLLDEAVENNINLVAITDHNAVGVTDEEKKLFLSREVEYVQGCEVLTDNGAHIIGLFVGIDVLKAGTDPRDIVDAIQRDGGMVLIPHPFKPKSGFVARYKEDAETLDYVLSKSSLIEAFNADYKQSEQIEETRRLADRYRLHVVASSDAHKPWRLAHCWTEYDVDTAALENPASLLRLKPSNLVVKEEAEKTGIAKWRSSLLKMMWNTAAYQWMVAIVPFRLKRSVKRILYEISRCCRRARCR